MKIHKVITGIELNIEDLTYMLTAANVAGYMEAKEKICVDDDNQLTEAVVDIYSDWLKETCPFPWPGYVENELTKRFGVTVNGVEVNG